MTEQSGYSPFPTFADFLAGVDFDSMLFDTMAARFAEHAAAAGEAAKRNAIDTATRWAAANTGAIEGLYEIDRGITVTIAKSAAALDSAHLQVGDAALDHIKDALRAYEYVLDAATGQVEISEKLIRELHAVTCDSQQTYTVYTEDGQPRERPLDKGQYKTDPNNPLRPGDELPHHYAAPGDETSAEMARLVDELRTEAFASAHPVLQASYAHYGFVCIHPFADGNGRVSRALASVYLYRSPGVPLVIFVDQKPEYLDSLERADAGSCGEFVRFISEATIDAVGMLESALRAPSTPPVGDLVQQFRRALVSKDGLAHSEVDALEQRVREAWEAELGNAILGLGDIAPISLRVAKSRVQGGQVPAGFRSPPNARFVSLAGSTPPPGQAEHTWQYEVLIPKADNEEVDAAFVVFRRSGHRLIDVNLREVHPKLTGALRFRLRTAADSEVATTIEVLIRAGERVIRDAGY